MANWQGIQWHECSLKNYVWYKEAKLDLSVRGVTIIYGFNKNAGDDLTNSNGAGKTLLLSPLTNIRYGSSPVVQDVKVRSKSKDGWRKGSAQGISFSTDGHRYDCTKNMIGSNFEFDLLRNGKPSKVATTTFAQKKLEELLPWSEQEFYTMVYLDGRTKNPLQFGSPTQRLEFFSKLFDLDHIDTMRKLVKQHLSTLRDDALIAKELEGQLDLLTAEVDKFTHKDAELQELRILVDKRNKKLQAWYKELSLLRFAKVQIKDYELVKQYGVTHEKLAELAKKLSGQVKLAQQKQANAVEWERYKEKLASWKSQQKEAKEALEEHLESATISSNVEEWQPLLESTLSKIAKYETIPSADVFEESIEKYTTVLIKSWQRLLDSLGSKNVAKVTLTSIRNSLSSVAETMSEFSASTKDIEKVNAELNIAKTNLRTFSKSFQGEDCNCSTCFQSVSEKLQKKIINGLKSEITELEENLANLESQARMLSYFQSAEGILEEITKLEADLVKARNNDQKLTAALAIKQDIQKAIKLHAAIKPKPVEPDCPQENAEDLAEEIRQKNTLISICNNLGPRIADIHSLVEKYGEDMDDTIQELEEAIERLSTKSKAEANQLAELEAEYRVYLQNKDKLAQLQARVDKLQKNDEAELYEILYDCLGNKVLKTIMVQKLAKHLELSINNYSHLLFREKIRFEFTVAENAFNIVAHRRSNGVTLVDDVRTLSGAESKAFSYLLAVAMIPLVPAKYRSSVMVIDEPCDSLDPMFETKFTTEFIPKLCSIVPTVVLIAPHSLDIPHPSQIIRVVKEGNVSKAELIYKRDQV